MQLYLFTLLVFATTIVPVIAPNSDSESKVNSGSTNLKLHGPALPLTKHRLTEQNEKKLYLRPNLRNAVEMFVLHLLPPPRTLSIYRS